MPSPTPRTRTRIPRLRANSRLGKYKIEARLSEGEFSHLYRAFDTIEGHRVALKIPHPHLADDQFLASFRNEARLAAGIQHPCILSLKDASIIDDHFVLVYPLGEESLADRLTRRISSQNLNLIIEQCLEGLAELHSHRIMHCDIKPENFIMFPGPAVRLADFGIARQAMRTLHASGSGTLGYMAPEQAMGKPSFRSDVFAMGLLLYRMITGQLPEYPFKWPPPEYSRLRRKARPAFIAIIRKSMDVQPRRRFRDADALHRAYLAMRKSALF
ncbi:MAG: serine/threonine protein kinase [Akkermansiaceae bacterium]|nr:serine/threonine protein kinase [Akkermansiaceae bacterium]NNM29240.1 serine/threonine protein kinase [Akkermansiaceae bacterium]